MTSIPFDALLLVSFGGPEQSADVIPYLDHVLAGKRVPESRKLEVAEHYEHFDGASPINAQNRALLEELRTQMNQAVRPLPVYWGNRHWHPFLTDTLRQMADDGVRHALAFVTSAYSSYSGCRQYLEAIEAARQEVGARAPRVAKLRSFFNHPRFIDIWTARLGGALQSLDPQHREQAVVLFTAHSIPLAMASRCHYVDQLEEVSRLVAARASLAFPNWQLVYQSRSGPPHQPWLEPDVVDVIRQLAERGVKHVVLAPVGFISDHMEILFDLDTEAAETAREVGVQLVRAETPSRHPQFAVMVRELVDERLGDSPQRATVGRLAALPDQCPDDCCPLGR